MCGPISIAVPIPKSATNKQTHTDTHTDTHNTTPMVQFGIRSNFRACKLQQLYKGPTKRAARCTALLITTTIGATFTSQIESHYFYLYLFPLAQKEISPVGPQCEPVCATASFDHQRSVCVSLTALLACFFFPSLSPHQPNNWPLSKSPTTVSSIVCTLGGRQKPLVWTACPEAAGDNRRSQLAIVQRPEEGSGGLFCSTA